MTQRFPDRILALDWWSLYSTTYYLGTTGTGPKEALIRWLREDYLGTSRGVIRTAAGENDTVQSTVK